MNEEELKKEAEQRYKVYNIIYGIIFMAKITLMTNVLMLTH